MSGNGQAREVLTADFRLVLDDIDALVKAASNMAEGEVAELQARIHDRLDRVQHAAVDARRGAVEYARNAATATQDYVHAHPWQAVAAGAAVGVAFVVAIGLLAGRR